MNYLDTLNNEVKQYFKILSPEFPEWLLEYINTPPMQRNAKISNNCGINYSKCFQLRYIYTSLDHGVGTALILWHFTHDKKQTLAGLFHDISTPCFKHCIDFMNGDSQTQESTEELTDSMIRNSKEIMSLLERDGIKIEEVNDYKLYPIADNPTPQLAADRFEYTFSGGLIWGGIWNSLSDIQKFYNNITIGKNEKGIDELMFQNKEICEEYISCISKLWPEWISSKDRVVMQFYADICKSMNVRNYLSIEDLYELSEKEVIDKIIHCEDKYLSESFQKFQNTTQVYDSNTSVSNKYCINTRAKIRYIVPLVQTENGPVRINKISEQADKDIQNYLAYKQSPYVYFDFDFKPYEA